MDYAIRVDRKNLLIHAPAPTMAARPRAIALVWTHARHALQQFGGVDELGFAEAGGEAEDGLVVYRDACEPHGDATVHMFVSCCSRFGDVPIRHRSGTGSPFGRYWRE